MKYQIGNIVSLVKGDTKSKWIVVAHTDNPYVVKVVHEDEVDCASMPVDVSMIKIAHVSDARHKELLTAWVKSREGKEMVKTLTR